MRIALAFGLFLISVPFLQGQTFYALKIDRKIRFEARDITAKYQPYLVMGVDQALEFQSTVARFLVKKRAVEQDDSLSPKGKYEVLRRVSSRETSEMAHVLESYRWQEYMRVKPQIQPIPIPLDFSANDSLPKRARKKEPEVVDVPPPKVEPKKKKQKQITIYTYKGCGACDSIVGQLKAGNFTFRSVSLDERPEVKEQLGQILSKSAEEMDSLSSPVISLGGRLYNRITTFDQMMEEMGKD
ncbi:hypothetical protein LV716_01250 [Flagellimonas sp. HMM57]|uniref:glutaredoxin domain-containing protein n=1 Tax=unclassified Flagellimonas TaxID=2644544 RepID=UPI0013D31AF2|nr:MULTISPECIES: glutaredoxin domain-containing protein [unclassified Flagellimonas]UII76440.1 hypothetical protein LV716_01250 [Flagellimonas sp. HMM57]